MKRTISAILVLTFAVLACQTPGLTPLPNQEPDLQPTEVIPSEPVTTSPIVLDGSLTSLYQQVIPGVVAIRTDLGQGSGFIFDNEGHVITNKHVIDGANIVEISFSSGYKSYGTIVAFDANADIAVIKVNTPPSDMQALPIGDSDLLQVGQPVIAIGNPFGLSGTMTLGIISALGRTQPAEQVAGGGGYFSNADIIQTDAAINPGNSGGPLFNLNGEVIGVNQSIRTDNVNQVTGNAVNSGVGFSISINLVKKIVPGLIKEGTYEYPYLGITSSSELSLNEIEALGLNQFTGAYVIETAPGGPADAAGIVAGNKPSRIQGLQAGGDLIVAFDGKPIFTFDQLLSYLITTKSPGDTVVLTVLRDGQTMDISVTLGKRP